MFGSEILKELKTKLNKWEKTSLKDRLTKVKENKAEFKSGSGPDHHQYRHCPRAFDTARPLGLPAWRGRCA